jgi:hypothetical protein
MLDGSYCFRHSPEHREAAAEASRLGGMRRRKTASIEIVYDVRSLETFEDILQLLDIAKTDTLSLENGVPRNRTLVYLAAVARQTLYAVRIEQRLAALERVLTRSWQGSGS